MKQNRGVKTAIAIVGLVLMLAACLEEIEKIDRIQKTTFEPSIDFPLVDSDFSMEEFLTEGKSKARITEQGGLMILMYDDSLSTPAGDLFYSLSNQQSPTLSITGPEVTFPAPGGTVTVSKNTVADFNSSETLDSVRMKAGNLVFQISSTFQADISLTVDIQSLKIQGQKFQRTFTFTGSGSQSPSIDLSGAVLDLTDHGTTTNKISFSIIAVITSTGQPVGSTDRLDCSFRMNGLQLGSMFGQLSEKSFPFKADSINVDIFDNAFSGSFELLSPSITLGLRNSFGLPIGFDIQNIAVIKKDETLIPLTGAAVSAPANPYRINAPSYAQVGQSVKSEISINADNSNLPQLISTLPRYLSYQFNLALNPAPVTSKNFVLDSSKLIVGIHLELPFHGKIKALTLSKRYDFNGLGIDDPGKTKILVKTRNETPLDALVQVYFVDVSGTVLDSLFNNPSILKAAPVDADGFTQESAGITTEVAISQEKIDRIEQAEYLDIATVINTTEGGAVPVKFSASNKIKINIGVNTRVQYKMN